MIIYGDGKTTYTDADSLSGDLREKIIEGDQKAFQALQEYAKNDEKAEVRARAIYELAEVYFNGYCGVEISQQKALELLQKAVEQNDIAAMKKIGEFYRDGEQGFNIDYKKALEYFTKIGDGGFYKGYELAAEMLTEKHGIIDNYGQKAIDLYQKLADLEDDDALSKIAKIYEEGLGEISPNSQAALEVYREIVRGKEYWVEVYQNFKIDTVYLQNYKKALRAIEKIHHKIKSDIS